MAEQKPNFNRPYCTCIANVDVRNMGNRPIIRIASHSNHKGIGINLADIVCVCAGIDKTEKAGNLKEEEVKKLNQVVDNLAAEQGIPAWIFNRRKDYDTGKRYAPPPDWKPYLL